MLYDCGHQDITRGYGTDPITGKTYCYACCAERDKQYMRDHGEIVLYLCGEPGAYRLTNWPGTLIARPWRVRIGRHNMVGKRYDVWFTFENRRWHGVQYGDNTQLCHCRMISAA